MIKNNLKIHYEIKPSFTTRKIKELEQENKQLKDNWNELRKQEINRFNKTQDVQFLYVLQDMQEIEKSDSE